MEFGVLFWASIALIVLIIVTLIAFVIYSGLFATIQPGAGPPFIKNVQIAYKFGRGPYNKEVGQYFSEVTSLVPHLRCLGLYYDDPKEVEPSKLRWAVGCVLAEGDGEVPQEELQLLLRNGYRVWDLPSVSHVVKCSFPYTTFFSLFIAIYRVYPLMGEYVKSNKLCAHPYMELYSDGTIHFMAPLARQDEFYVPEANRDPGDTTDDETPLDVAKPSTSGSFDLIQTASKQDATSRDERSKADVAGSAGKKSASDDKAGKSDTAAVQEPNVSSTASGTAVASAPLTGASASTSDGSVSQAAGEAGSNGSNGSSGSETDFEVIKKEDMQ